MNEFVGRIIKLFLIVISSSNKKKVITMRNIVNIFPTLGYFLGWGCIILSAYICVQTGEQILGGLLGLFGGILTGVCLIINDKIR